MRTACQVRASHLLLFSELQDAVQANTAAIDANSAAVHANSVAIRKLRMPLQILLAGKTNHQNCKTISKYRNYTNYQNY